MSHGKRVLITGASGDIGAAIARCLAAQNWQVILHANRNSGRIEALADAVRADGGTAELTCFDVTDADATTSALEALLADTPIDAVVSNAGIHDDAPMAGMSHEQWRRVIDVSLHGFFNVTQPLLLPMARQRFGRIVAIGSVAGVLGNRGQSNYAAAKAALGGAVKSLAREMGSRGITANVVAPGVIAGAMTEELFDPAQIKAIVPAARSGKPEEVAALVAFLCSDLAGYINGQVIGVNGGMG